MNLSRTGACATLLFGALVVVGCDDDGKSESGDTATDAGTAGSTSEGTASDASTSGSSTTGVDSTTTASTGTTGEGTDGSGGLYSLLGSLSNDDMVSGQWVLTVTDMDGATVHSNDGSLATSAMVEFNAEGLADGLGYSITLESSPADLCEGQNLEGTIDGADVTGIDITCTADELVRYAIDGTITGVEPADGYVRLVDTDGNDLDYTASYAGAGVYGFTGVPENSVYELIFSNDAFNCTGNESASGTLTGDVLDAVLTCS